MRKLFLLFLPFFIAAIHSCMGEDEYSNSPTDRLTFSTDTVSLDTIISGEMTNTYTFEIYNPNPTAIRIARAYLSKGNASVFSVNVDGTYLENGTATDFEIAGNDSMRVFVAAKTEDSGTDLPVFANDELIFQTETGISQKVVLEAYGQSVIKLKALSLTADTTFSAKRPYQIYDSLVVADGTTLTISPGVRLYFHPSARLIVHGTLIAKGSVDSVIVMRGDRMGYMFSNQPYDRIPGQWGGIIFTSGSYGNQLNFCDIHSGTFGINCKASDITKEKLRLENSLLHNMSDDCLTAYMSNVFVGNSQLTNAGGNCVTLRGGYYTFIQNTIANFYAFSSTRGVALDYANYEGSQRLPLTQALFANCLITGYSTDEIRGASSTTNPDDAFEYQFTNCLLNTPTYEDENRVQNCLWDNSQHVVYREGNFSPAFDLKQLLFTFGLDVRSQAVDHADADIARTYYPTDKNGKSRFSDTAPDIGCYELTQP